MAHCVPLTSPSADPPKVHLQERVEAAPDATSEVKPMRQQALGLFHRMPAGTGDEDDERG